jgi:predicted flavoprotein YhiN
MENYQIAVIGAGPAGMMAAIRASELLSPQSRKSGRKNSKKTNVILIEKKEHLGKKLLLTGGGRCNITNTTPIKDMVKLFGKKGSFLKPSLYNLDNNALLDLFREKGLEFKIEDQGRVFPEDDKANSVLEVLKDYLHNNSVQLRLNSPVQKIKLVNGSFEIVLGDIGGNFPEMNRPNKSGKNDHRLNQKQGSIIKASKVIIATGGVSYPPTGSTGTGLKIAKTLGHNITPLNPSLVPLRVHDDWVKSLSGIKLDDVTITLKTGAKKKISNTGTVLFTHFGLSGPGILDLSHEVAMIINKAVHINKPVNTSSTKPELPINKKMVNLYLDLIPHSSRDELNQQLLNDFQKHGNRLIKTYMKLLLPNNMINTFLEQLDINPQKNLSSISRKERNSIIDLLKSLEIHVTGTLPIEKGMVTCGGISFKEIHSKTMESKLLPRLYFAGEIIEFCGPTGGYNLQMAFSTGYTAGEHASKP